MGKLSLRLVGGTVTNTLCVTTSHFLLHSRACNKNISAQGHTQTQLFLPLDLPLFLTDENLAKLSLQIVFSYSP